MKDEKNWLQTRDNPNTQLGSKKIIVLPNIHQYHNDKQISLRSSYVMAARYGSVLN